jgi:hypothetical protein
MRLARALVADYVKNNKIATLQAAGGHLHRSPAALSEGIARFRKLYAALFDLPLEQFLQGPGWQHGMGIARQLIAVPDGCAPPEAAAPKLAELQDTTEGGIRHAFTQRD